MVHKNNKWNMSKKRGEEILHRNIIKIIKNSTDKVSLNDLIILLNQNTKDIKFISNKQRKPISCYIRGTYGNLMAFINLFSMYGVIYHNNISYIVLMNHNVTEKHKHNNNDVLSEGIDSWELVSDDEFIII